MSSIREGQDMITDVNQSKRCINSQKETRIIAIIVVVFIVTCLPKAIMLIFFMLTRHTSRDLVLVYNMGYALQCLNSTLNPLCYAVGNPAFRTAVTSIFSGMINC